MRRSMAPTGPAWWVALRHRDFLWSALFVCAFALVGSLVVLLAGRQPRYYLGQELTHPIVPRVTFVHEDVKATDLARERARQEQPNVYRSDLEVYDDLRDRLIDLPAVLAEYERVDQVPREIREPLKIGTQTLRALRQRFPVQQDPQAREAQFQQWNTTTRAFLRTLFQDIAVFSPGEYPSASIASIDMVLPYPDPSEPSYKRLYRSGFYKIDERERIARWLTHGNTPGQGAATSFGAASMHYGVELAPTVAAVVVQSLRPTYHFDEELTSYAKEAAASSVAPVERKYESGNVLVRAGTRLGETDLALLQREWEAYESSLPLPYSVLRWASVFGVVLIIGIGLWGYIWTYNYKVIRNPMRGFALVTLLLLMQFLAVSLTNWQPEILYATAIIPTLLATVILTIVYDQRFALAVGAFHVAVIMLSLALPIGFALVMLTGVGVSIAMLREVRTRSRVVVVGVWSGLAMAVATLLSAIATRDLLIDGELRRIVTEDAVLAGITGISVGVLVQGVLPAIERLFRVTTAMTLKELNDASHPLLQRLAQEAPGTYQHSLRIADMAEAAAEAVDGNGLLCRVGAMYHDIGKVNKPMYFIENQGGGPNRHSKLSPAMSLLIIVGHVKDGVEMGREAGLPVAIRHLIESHHGTTLVEYFYHAAKRQKEAADEGVPSEFEFRYPGPKPQTKEAAIILLCDSIEAAARTLADPTPIRIEQLVHNLAMKRLMDGQFDECNLTLSELHKIEQAITKTLNAIYHARIKYPGDRQAPQQQAPAPTPQAPVPAEPTPPPAPPAAAAS